MTYAVYDSGSWKNILSLFTKISGVWTTIKGAYIYNGGGWHTFFLWPQAFVGGATLTFGSDGTVDGTGNDHWFPSTSGGVGSLFWFRCTRTSGNPGTAFASAGTWRSLASNVTQTMTGAGACAGTIEFATDSGGVNIVGHSTISLNNAA